MSERVTITEALRRLVSYGDLLYRTASDGGKEVLIKDGRNMKRVIIP